MTKAKSSCPWCDTENVSEIDGQKFDTKSGTTRNVHYVSCRDCAVAYWFFEGEEENLWRL